MDFYHELAPLYDQMIRFHDRLADEKIVFRSILEYFPAKSALDAGCGSGFHCIVLAQLGLRVTGTDNSPDMLQLARRNAKKYNADIEFIASDFVNMKNIPGTDFDAVYCLGNGFVHLLTEEEQIQALINFKSLLKPAGYLCLQIINYDKFLEEKRELLAVKKVGNKVFTRTYRYHPPTLTFNVEVNTGAEIKNIATELYPLRQEEILRLLRKADFKDIRCYGNLNLKTYEPLRSENLCVFCR